MLEERRGQYLYRVNPGVETLESSSRLGFNFEKQLSLSETALFQPMRGFYPPLLRSIR